MNLHALNDSATLPDGSIVQTIDDAISRLQAKGTEFANVYRQLLADESAASSDPATYATWQNYKSKADTIMGTISYINSKVDTAVNWFKDLFGLGGVDAFAFLPVLPIAYIVAAIAAMTYFITDYLKWREGLGAGYSPGQINAGGVTSQISSTVMWAAIGLLAVFVLPKLLEKR